MKLLCTILLASLCLVGAVSSGVIIPSTPDHVLLQNKFAAVKSIGDYLVAMESDALIVLDYDPEDSVFNPVRHIWLDVTAVEMKTFDDIVIIRSENDDIHFYDATDLPDLKPLGAVTLPISFDDFVYADQSLYISTWFLGLQRYEVPDFSSVQFADSSMIGVLVTQLQLENDTLFAIDRYNGIMRYDISSGNLDGFIDYLLVPFQATAFTKVDSLLIISSLSENAYLGKFGLHGSGIIDSITNPFTPTAVLSTDEYYAIFSERFLQIVDRKSLQEAWMYPKVAEANSGDLVVLDGSPHIAVPGNQTGLTLYGLGETQVRRSGLARPGPISDVILKDKLLYTSGTGNPIDAYRVDSGQAPVRAFSMLDDLVDTRAMTFNGDSLIAYYASRLNRIAVFTHATDPDSFLLESSFTPKISQVEELRYTRNKIDTSHGLFVIGAFDVDAYSVSDSAVLTHQNTWSFFGGVDAIEIVDQLVFVATGKRQLEVYRIQNDFELSLRASLKLAGRVERMLPINGDLWLIEQSDIRILDYSDPNLPAFTGAITLPFRVFDAAPDGNYVWAVGSGGLIAFDTRDSIPSPVSSGGRLGFIVTAENGTVVTSDFSSVSVYHLNTGDSTGSPGPGTVPSSFALSQNYPNPFNGTTNINFDLDRAGHVKIEIFNQLGQRVSVLEDRRFDAGVYTTAWNGQNSVGQVVASGIYFYRIVMGEVSQTRKMIFSK